MQNQSATSDRLNQFLVDNLGVFVGVIATTAAIMNYVYTHFQTKEISQQTSDRIERRLERIEDKIDRLVESNTQRK